MQYIELTFNLMPNDEAARDVLAALLAEAGCETFVPTETGQMAYIRRELLEEDNIKTAIDSFQEFFPQVQVSYTCDEAPDENWNATWESEHHFEPIILTDGQQIQIIPRQAFGSGEHATTRMMLKLLSTSEPLGKTVIDAGCGTGVLGIAALKLGARQVFAYDIDEWSVRNALDNFILNGFPASSPSPSFSLSPSSLSPSVPSASSFPPSVPSASSFPPSAPSASSFPPSAPSASSFPPSVPSASSFTPSCSVSGGSSAAPPLTSQLSSTIALGDAATALPAAPQADLLLANINRNILLSDLPFFSRQIKPGGHLLLSGFLEADIPALTETASHHALTLLDTQSDGEWRALKFLKS